MHKLIISLAISATLVTAPLAAQEATEPDSPQQDVSEQRLRSDVERLVAFGTRHTLSEQDNPVRGIGAAVDWGANTLRGISSECGGCLTVELPERMEQGRRLVQPTKIRNVVAIQRGTERPDEVVIVQAHIDSRVSDPLDWQSDAPGANDDGSGTALVIEAARLLSQRRYPSTIVYALLSGEEQGLYGGRLMADYAEQQGWTVKAVLNNDIVGGSCGSDGKCDADHVRVFSEGPRFDLDDGTRRAQRQNGGENDSPSRNLSRWIDTLADEDAGGLDVRQIWRTDRMGRGGDHIPFLEKGYPAVRFSVAIEDYEHQHQDVRSEAGTDYGDTVDEMDFAYLAKVTALNVRALDRLAMAPMPPASMAEAAVQTYTDISWSKVSGATSYTIWQRRPDMPYWKTEPVISDIVAESARLEGVRGDDWIFGVSARAADGSEGPVSSAVPGGGFRPLETPATDLTE